MGICKTVPIIDKSVVVKELTMQDIHDIAMNDMRDGSAIDGICMLLSKCTDIDREFIMRHHPSDLQPLIDTMLEVNKAFFDQAAALEMVAVAALIKNKISGIFMLACLPSSEPVME